MKHQSSAVGRGVSVGSKLVGVGVGRLLVGLLVGSSVSAVGSSVIIDGDDVGIAVGDNRSTPKALLPLFPAHVQLIKLTGMTWPTMTNPSFDSTVRGCF